MPITSQEISSCADAASIVGVSGFRSGPCHILKFVADNSDTEIVCLDESGIRHLTAVLKALFPSFGAIDSVGVTVEIPGGAVRAESYS
jgi:hypothetical protein